MAALLWTQISLMAYFMLDLWPSGSFEKTYQVSQVIRTTPTHQSGVLMEGCPRTGGYMGICEVVPQDGSASVVMKITDGSLHASFVAIRQL